MQKQKSKIKYAWRIRQEQRNKISLYLPIFGVLVCGLVVAFFLTINIKQLKADTENTLPVNKDKEVIWKGLIETTAYSAIDSCHYKDCLNASLKKPSELSVACPRNLKLGTVIRVNGEIKICDDRYNSNLSDRIDIWFGYTENDHLRASEYGHKKAIVEILK